MKPQGCDDNLEVRPSSLRRRTTCCRARGIDCARHGGRVVHCPGRDAPGPRVAEQGAQARQQVLEVHRTTVVSLRDAAGEAAPADQVRRALTDARKGLEALADATAAPIPDALRKELRTSASSLTDLADAPRQTVRLPSSPFCCCSSACGRTSPETSGRADVRGQLQPVQAEGTRVRRPRVGDGAGTRRRCPPRTTACPCRSYSKRGRA